VTIETDEERGRQLAAETKRLEDKRLEDERREIVNGIKSIIDQKKCEDKKKKINSLLSGRRKLPHDVKLNIQKELYEYIGETCTTSKTEDSEVKPSANNSEGIGLTQKQVAEVSSEREDQSEGIGLNEERVASHSSSTDDFFTQDFTNPSSSVVQTGQNLSRLSPPVNSLRRLAPKPKDLLRSNSDGSENASVHGFAWDQGDVNMRLPKSSDETDKNKG
jgi:hypothetical protein